MNARFVLLSLTLLTVPALAVQAATNSTGPALFKYVPPVKGAPAKRIGGASRGPQRSLPSVQILAPESSALTSDPSPRLYWYLSGSSRYPLELTVSASDAVLPVLEIPLTAPGAPAVYEVDLGQYGVKLKPGVEYLWSVSVVRDDRDRSDDMDSSGSLQLSQKRPAGGDSVDNDVRQLLKQGYWYDAIALISEQIKLGRDADKWRKVRADLSEQVGLKEVAAYDRQH